MVPNSSHRFDDSVGGHMNSKKARKQRKSQKSGPIHKKRKMVASHLEPSLREEYNRRSIQVTTGDTVLVLRGEEEVEGAEGKVSRVNIDDGTVVIEGITMSTADGSEVERPIHASNLMIVKLDLSDPYRKDKLLRSQEGAE